jgi:putative oxidoreductase
MSKVKKIVYWLTRIIAAIILLQTLYFKFSASEESVYIFSTVGMEPIGRIGIGILELVASVLLLINATAWIGAGLSAGLMAGAIFMHLTLLGIEVKNDGGYLFLLAVIVLTCNLVTILFNREKILHAISSIKKSS